MQIKNKFENLIFLDIKNFIVLFGSYTRAMQHLW